MEPFTFAMLAGAGINALGKLMGGASSSAIDSIQAQAANANTELLDKQADVAHMGVDFAASKEREQLGKIEEAGRSTLSTRRSYFAGNNLDPTFGSPLLVQAMTAGRVATDRNLAGASFAIDKANALSNEANLRGQAAGSAATALGATIKGSADMMAGVLGAGTALLSGASAVGGFGGGSGGPLGTMQVGQQFFPAYG